MRLLVLLTLLSAPFTLAAGYTTTLGDDGVLYIDRNNTTTSPTTILQQKLFLYDCAVFNNFKVLCSLVRQGQADIRNKVVKGEKCEVPAQMRVRFACNKNVGIYVLNKDPSRTISMNCLTLSNYVDDIIQHCNGKQCGGQDATQGALREDLFDVYVTRSLYFQHTC